MPPKGPLGPPPKASRSAPKIYVPPSVMHVAARAAPPRVNRGPSTRPARSLPYNPRVGTPRGTAIVTRPAAQTRAGRRALKPVRQGTPRGTGYTVSQMARQGQAVERRQSSYLHSPGYRKALISVFMHQPTAQKALLLNKAAKLPTNDPTRLALESVRLPAQIGASPLSEAAIRLQTAGITPSGVFKIAKNAASDIWNLPLGTVESTYGLGKQGVEGLSALGSGNVSGFLSHEGNAVKSVVDPFVQLAEHPVRTFQQHPVDTLLMFSGAKSLLGKSLGGLARMAPSDAARAAASTVREPLHIGTVAGEPSPIVESRAYSRDLINKAFQTAHERTLRARGRNPNVAGPAPRMLPRSLAYALNTGVEAKLQRVADEMTSNRQAMGRQDRVRVLHELHKQAPKGAGRHIVSHVLQGVIRTPETAAEDITKEINRLKAARTGKRTAGEIMNRRQVKALDQALKEPGAVRSAFNAAEKIRPQINAQDVALLHHGLLDPEQAMRSKLFPYAMAHMGAKFDHQLGELVNADGSKLSTQTILDHLKRNEVPDPAYVGHFPGKVSPARFYSTYRLARGSLKAKRTGEAFRSGAYDHTFEGLAGQVASRAEQVTKASLHDKVVNRLGIAPSPTQMRQLLQHAGVSEKQIRKAMASGLFTPNEARIIAHAVRHDDLGNEIPGALHLTPISAAPHSVLDQVANLQHPRELGNVSQVELQGLAHAITDAAKRTDGQRNVTLVPTVAAHRFADQFARTDTVLRGVGRATQQFRRTVLPYSTHWMAQIGAEAGLRALLGGVLDPRGLVEGRRLWSNLKGTEAGRSALQEMVNATFYNKHDPLAIHNPNAGRLVSGMRAFPPTRLLIAAHNRYANTVGHAMGALERNARLMGLGHFAHQEAQAFGHSWRDAVLLQGKTMEQLATRLKTDPALVARLGRQIDDVFGKYNKFTPVQRMMVQSFMPFLPWYLNAAKYVLYNLPAHHPVSAALLASLRQTLNQDIADGKKAPLSVWAAQDLARISPFGIFRPPSTTPSTGAFLEGQDITGAVLPQAESALYNLAGLNVFGDAPLKEAPSPGNYRGDVKPKSGPAAAAATESLLEAFLPATRLAREALAGGRKTYGTSTVLSPQPEKGAKGGDLGTILNRTENPFYAFEAAKGQGPPYGSAKAQKAAYLKSKGGGATGNQWTVVQSNPKGTHATHDTWKVVTP
jgi:hypothetical protein